MLKKDMFLYHGSYLLIRQPDLSYCREGKDFGKGLYVTSDLWQARSFAKISSRKARQNNTISEKEKKAYVSCFVYRPVEKSISEGSLDGMRVHEFLHADREWLRCIVAHRTRRLFPEEIEKWKDYDILCGKIANDDTNATITAFIGGVFGDVNSERAMDTAISLLLPERLKDQMCFRTERALRALQYQGYKEVIL